MSTPADASTDEASVAFAGVLGQRELLRAGTLSSRELVSLLLGRIERLDPQLRAFRIVLAEQALTEADAADAARRRGDERPLLGIPIPVKDDLDVAGLVTGNGSLSYRRVAEDDAVLVQRLRAAGAIIIGKTNLPEYAQWSVTSSVAHGVTRNPFDPTRAPGGSSGGAAAAVAAGLVPAATGSDGAGSIRIPSAWCGLFGLKPQRGRISTLPQRGAWHGLGVVGFLTRTVTDAALLYDLTRGSLPEDRWRADEPRMPFQQAVATEPGRLRILVSSRSAIRGIGPIPEVRAALGQTAQRLAELGHDVEVRDIALPDSPPGVLPQMSNGVAQTLQASDAPGLTEARTRGQARAGRLLAPAVPLAMRYGQWAAARVDRLFAPAAAGRLGADLLVLPTVPHLPLPADGIDGLGLWRTAHRCLPSMAYTSVFNMTGHPAAAVPVGLSPDGLPTSVQLVAARADEPTILQVAQQIAADLRPSGS